MPEMSAIELLQKYLNLASQRENLVTTNMANIDTPGFRTVDLDFHTEMQRAVNDQGNASMTPVVRPVSGLLARPDGNNVNLDREGLLLAETQMQVRIGVELIKSEFHRLLTAINQGQSE
jgi:flagellar basal-body rod protein FlgB